ncbi:efflux RND transporter periplasmic adaptor subunit [Planctomicrobium piriforme]|uniref:efflux RND transporter periplasmic adaptor subunit n=1 Tax=Planctomicrobium piriforme TaxID=1576369 RepID=UPI0015876F34|nr:efflux RND transporter periplasmic adaptor subunit [Planctomicrobium piriforme]
MRRCLMAGVAASVVGTAGYFTLSRSPGHLVQAGTPARTASAETAVPPVVRSGPNELTLSSHVAEKMGLQTTPADMASHAIRLPSFQGVLALDHDRLSRVHARFGGEVVKIGHSTDGSDPPLRVGDQVQKGDLLAVIWSTDLGNKKSEFVDALTKLKSEEQLRDRLKLLHDEGAGPGRSYRDAERDVQTRMVEVANVERTLRTWRLTDSDIADIRGEAERLMKTETLSHDMEGWARLEVRAPMSGIILEKNIVVGDIVDATTDMFKIGQLSTLAVWAHVYEEDLPLLESLPRPVKWTVTLPSRPGSEYLGTLDKVGSVIDSAQHTALLTGSVENPDGALKVGQFVTVMMQLPPSENELELPTKAVVEDGRQSVVFIQVGDTETRFERRPVNVIRRFRDEIYVTADQAGLHPGERIVTSGALMLQNAMDQLPPPAVSTANTSLETEQHEVLNSENRHPG